MIIFWLMCAVFVAIALAFVLPPLLQGSGKKPDERGRPEANIAVYRDQIAELEADQRNGIISREQYEQDRDELERRLLEDVATPDEPSTRSAKPVKAGRGVVYAVALGVPIVALSLYFRVGNPDAISASATARSQPTGPVSQQGAGQRSQQQIEANVAALAKRLEQNPNDAEGWIMLARSYGSLEKYGDASAAYAKATALKSNDADLLADYAFALAMANGQQLQGEPTELIDKALKLDPESPKALELAGSAAFQAKDYGRAVTYWQKLLKKAPANSEVAKSLSERISEAQTLLSQR
ncbi:MAG: c-type cytochrome biogenesis protein CcmI [Pyrinomonadaceae bacterium]